MCKLDIPSPNPETPSQTGDVATHVHRTYTKKELVLMTRFLAKLTAFHARLKAYERELTAKREQNDVT